MSTKHSIKVRDTEQVAKVMSGSWGLKQCSIENCPVCLKWYGTPTMTHARNMFISGVPYEFIPSVFDGLKTEMTGQDVHEHAFRAGWVSKRGTVKGFVASEDMLAHMLMRRYLDSQHVVSGTTAEKTVELMMKLFGMGQEKRELKVSGSFSWENAMTRNRANPGILTIEDNLGEDTLGDNDAEIIEIEAESVEDEHAAAN